MLKRALVCGVLGFSLIALGLYLAPREAYAIQAPFKQHGQVTTAVVTAKSTFRRSYEGGGRDAGTKSYAERSITVRIPREADRQVTIDQLVLAADYRALDVGDEVSITYITREHTGRGIYYLLSSSVNAGTIALLPWAFGGRPASGLAIAAALPGVIFLLFFVAFLFESRPRPGASTAALALLLVACGARSGRDDAPRPPLANDPAGHDSAPAPAPAGRRCLPVVAAECGCVYTCGVGAESSAGHWAVRHDFWAGSVLDARVDRWCVDGQCTDAFFAVIVCDGICAPRPADSTCHFEGEGCVSSQPAR